MKHNAGFRVYTYRKDRHHPLRSTVPPFLLTVNTIKHFSLASVAVCACLLAACSTPQSRINNSPEVFARLNPDQQALVKAGQIAPGFDMDSVKLALGDPDHVTVRTDAAGPHEVWHYVTYEDNQGVVIYAGYYHRYRGWGGPFFLGGNPYYNGYPARIHDRVRVEFDVTNHVKAIEQEKS
jgi:outer membrane protein assembly factor BamE (lipoprotein component of BamABCDE complex)